MTIETREIYLTGDVALDFILQRLSDRVDILEGLRPDLEIGYFQLEERKAIATDTTVSSMASQSSDAVTITGGTIDGVPIGGTTPAAIGVTKLTITDSNSTVIHQFGEVE